MSYATLLLSAIAATTLAICVTSGPVSADPSRSTSAAAGPLQIETVPPVANVQFILSGPLNEDNSIPPDSSQTVVTDATGIATTEIPQPGTYRIEVSPLVEDESVRAEFSRWLDEVFSPVREFSFSARTLAEGSKLQVGFELSRSVTLRLVDLNGREISWDRAQSVSLASSIGQKQDFKSAEPQWLKSSRVTRRQLGLEVTEIQYSVESVLVDGANVVNRAQQKFFPKESLQWSIQLLLYSARFSASDAIFGFPIGSGVALTYPDGHVEEYAFGPSDEVVLEDLPRGEYKVQVLGRGYAPPRPVALSRDQVVHLQVVSYLDLGVMFLAIAIPALGLFLVGRPHLIEMARRRASSLGPNSEPPADGQPPTNERAR